MSSVSINELLNSNRTESRVYQMMETALIVSERFASLLEREEVDLDLVLGESEADTYDTLIGISLEIVKNHLPGAGFEDLRDEADELILKEYRKPILKTYEIQRNYWKTILVEASSEEEAKRIAEEQFMFNHAELMGGDRETITELKKGD